MILATLSEIRESLKRRAENARDTNGSVQYKKNLYKAIAYIKKAEQYQNYV